MGSPAIFAGKRSKLLSNKGLLNSNGSINDYNGDINYILNGHAEVNTAGWATYADAAQATPVNGTGGSPSVTWTQTTTSPLDDLASFVFTKDAVNRQGEGVSYDFTIDSASQAKVLTVSFDFIVGSGTFVAGATNVDSDLEVYLYDVTNSVLIQPSTYKLYSNSSTVSANFVSNFQTPYNSTSYRLIFHCATTSASAYTVKFDNVKVSPSQYVYGTPITDWTSYTPTWTSSGTQPSIGNGSRIGKWRRLGDSMEVDIVLLGGSTTAVGTGNYYYGLPSGFTIDTAKMAAGTAYWGPGAAGGAGGGYNTGGFYYTGISAPQSTTTFIITSPGTSSSPFGATVPFTFASGSRHSLRIIVPITGWSSSVQMSDNAAQNIVCCSYNKSATQAVTASVTNITFPNKTFDSTGSFDGTTFTAPVAGYYNITGAYIAATTATGFTIFAYVNATVNIGIGSNNSNGGDSAALSGVLYLNAGDALTIRSNVTVTLTATGYLQIHRLAGPNSIGATETVSCRYTTAAGQSIPNTGAVVDFGTKVWDSTGSVTTGASWKFTAPISGEYKVNAIVLYNSAGFTLNTAINLQLHKNGYVAGSEYAIMSAFYPQATNSYAFCINGTATIKLLAGDYISVATDHGEGANRSLFAGATYNFIEIIRTGNY